MEDKMYFDIRRRLSKYPNDKLFIIMGVRGNGKTRSCREYVIRRALNSGIKNEDPEKIEQFAGVRRTDVIFENVVKKFTQDIVIKEPYILESCRTGLYLGIKVTKELKGGETKEVYRRLCQLGHWVSLSKPEFYRSAGYEMVTTMVVDEFVLERGSCYLVNETEKFLSIVTSIGRAREDFKVIMISNNTNTDNPYFHEGKISYEEFPKMGESKILSRDYVDYDGEVHHFRAYLELCRQSEKLKKIQKNSLVGNLTSDTDYGKFALFGEYQTDNSLMVLSKPKDHLEFRFNFYAFGQEYGVYKLGYTSIGISKKTLPKGKNFHATQMDADMRGQCFNSAEWFAYELRVKSIHFNAFYEDPDIRDNVIIYLQKYK